MVDWHLLKLKMEVTRHPGLRRDDGGFQYKVSAILVMVWYVRLDYSDEHQVALKRKFNL